MCFGKRLWSCHTNGPHNRYPLRDICMFGKHERPEDHHHSSYLLKRGERDIGLKFLAVLLVNDEGYTLSSIN